MSAEVIESYLVGLGFEVNQPSLNTFQSALKTGGQGVASMTTGGIADFLKFQIAATTAFSTVAFGVVGFIEKLAMGDQQMRLFGMRSFMTVEQARGVQTALKVLGASIDDVAWDKELHQRFTTLIQDQRELSHMLGPQYEKQMHDVRDVWFQLQRLEVKGEYFGMKFAGDLLRKLGFGDGSILEQLEKLNAFVLQNMPAWSDELSSDVIPILKDFWGMVKDIASILGVAANAFTNLEATITGDDSLAGKTTSFHQFASAVGDAAHQLAYILHLMLDLEKVGANTAAFTFHGIASLFTMDQSKIDKLTGQQTEDLHGAGGALKDFWNDMTGGRAAYDGGGVTSPKAGGGGGGDVMSQARALAQRVSASTGIPASLIFSQWAHETGGFTNRGTTQLNNLAGIRYPGSTEYRNFNSLDDFASFYGNLVESKRYTSQGINQATTPEAFAHALKAGSYYEGKEGDYARGMKSFQPMFAPGGGGGGSTMTIGSINIPITSPGATGPEIAAHVQRGVRSALDEQNERLMVERGGAYR